MFNIYIRILVKRILSKALKFQLSKFNYIHELSVFYINVKTKLVDIKHRKLYNDDSIHCKKFLRQLNHLNLKRRLVGLLRD